MGLTVSPNRVLLTKGSDTIFDTQQPMPYLRLIAKCVLTFVTPRPRFLLASDPLRGWAPPPPTMRRSNYRTGRPYQPRPITNLEGGSTHTGHYMCDADLLVSAYGGEDMTHGEFISPTIGVTPPLNAGPYNMLGCEFSMKVGLVNWGDPSGLDEIRFMYGRIHHKEWPTGNAPIALRGKSQSFSGSMILNQVHKRGSNAVITEIMGLYKHQQWIILEYQVSHRFSTGWLHPEPFPYGMFKRQFELEVFAGGFK